MPQARKKRIAHDKPEDRLAVASQLEEIRLLEARAMQSDLRDGPLPGRISANAMVETSLSETKRLYRVTTTLNLLMSYDDDPKEPVILVLAKYRITFSVSDVKLATKEALADFSQGAAMFIIWPYWRQHVTNIFAQMTLPQYNLPLYTPGFFQRSQELEIKKD